jgi:hypothetical protein
LHVATAEDYPAATDLFDEAMGFDVGVTDEFNLQRLKIEGLSPGRVQLDEDP